MTQPDKAAKGTKAKIEKVLLIDDDPNIRKLAQMSLTRVGCWSVITAGCCAEGVQRAVAESPDLILLDVMMPEIDGPTTLSRIRQHEQLASVPVIFLTAKAQEHELESYIQLGAAGVIVKPFDPLKLPQQINSLLAEAD